jgi:hypothetical protein
MAELAAAEDARRRAQREAATEVLRAEQASRRPAEALLNDLDHGVSLLLRAALTAAGYHRHERGAWRRRRHVRHEGS